MMVMNQAMEPNANHVVNSVNLKNEDKSDRDFNPSVLGREFVRQYYTMLNEGPQNLYRFYGENSFLIHGNESSENVVPAFGQGNINEKLLSLDFKDCHTKIRQVDSLETVNKSVVIQVIGELSNNGQPMRRFFQTFILAPKTPTHYYVRNDIFRYQDEVFVDDDEGYTEDNNNLDDGNLVIDNTTIDTTDTNQATVLNSSLVNSNNTTLADKLNGQLNEPQEKSTSNNASSNDLQDRPSTKFSCNPDMSPINAVTINPTDLEQQLNNSGSEQSIDSSTLNNNSSSNNDKQINDDYEQEQEDNEIDQQAASSVLVQSQPQEQSQQDKPQVQEQRTYATMVQRKFGQLSTGSSSIAVINNSLDKKDGQLMKSHEESLVNTVLNNNKKDYLSSDWHFESNSNETTTATTTANHDSKSQRNGNQLSDEQQVFVDNLPSTIDENQLREYFIEYGEIVDVRICQKQGKTPNHGFITFNEAPVVKKILSKKPIYFNGHRINVEEKKSGRNFNSSNSGSFNRNKDKDHLSNRNFNSSTGSSNQFSAFSTGRVKEERNRGFKDKERKSANSNTSSGNRNSNSNFSRR